MGYLQSLNLVVFAKVEKLENHFLLIVLMKDKYLLQNINKDENTVG